MCLVAKDEKSHDIINNRNKYLIFQLCKENFGIPEGGAFMRKGKTGNWKEHFSPGNDVTGA